MHLSLQGGRENASFYMQSAQQQNVKTKASPEPLLDLSYSLNTKANACVLDWLSMDIIWPSNKRKTGHGNS